MMTEQEIRVALEIALTSDNPTVRSMFNRLMVAVKMVHAQDIQSKVANEESLRQFWDEARLAGYFQQSVRRGATP